MIGSIQGSIPSYPLDIVFANVLQFWESTYLLPAVQ